MWRGQPYTLSKVVRLGQGREGGQRWSEWGFGTDRPALARMSAPCNPHQGVTVALTGHKPDFWLPDNAIFLFNPVRFQFERCPEPRGDTGRNDGRSRLRGLTFEFWLPWEGRHYPHFGDRERGPETCKGIWDQ